MSSASIKVIKAGELADLWNEKPELTVIDVRTPGEFETVHARVEHARPRRPRLGGWCDGSFSGGGREQCR
jgi:hypothetical protein